MLPATGNFRHVDTVKRTLDKGWVPGILGFSSLTKLAVLLSTPRIKEAFWSQGKGVMVTAAEVFKCTTEELWFFASVAKFLGAFAFTVIPKHDDVVLLFVMRRWF